MKPIPFSPKAIIAWLALTTLAAINIAPAHAGTDNALLMEGRLDAIINAYHKANELPGMSVAIIRDGKMLYRKGFGFADVEEKKPATAETVYSIGSVSKPIGATLALALEEKGRLRDGRIIDLDLTRPTSDYLTDIPSAHGKGTVSLPAFHTHTVEQLLSHTGCVADYPDKTTPGIDNPSGHYDTALGAVQAIWDTGLVIKSEWADGGPCTMGKTWSYSTPAYTFVAAVLESATGKTIGQLLQEEIFTPFGLSGMRAKYTSPTLLTPDDNRATAYDKDNHKVTIEDDSWRVLGGGIETNAMDLARFGWKVLDGEILSKDTRDNRLWRRREVTNTNSPGYALGWGVTTDAKGRRIAEHPGMATGGRAQLWIYRDNGLVIAIVANRKEHPVDDVAVLAERIGDEILQ